MPSTTVCLNNDLSKNVHSCSPWKENPSSSNEPLWIKSIDTQEAMEKTIIIIPAEFDWNGVGTLTVLMFIGVLVFGSIFTWWVAASVSEDQEPTDKEKTSSINGMENDNDAEDDAVIINEELQVQKEKKKEEEEDNNADADAEDEEKKRNKSKEKIGKKMKDKKKNGR